MLYPYAVAGTFYVRIISCDVTDKLKKYMVSGIFINHKAFLKCLLSAYILHSSSGLELNTFSLFRVGFKSSSLLF